MSERRFKMSKATPAKVAAITEELRKEHERHGAAMLSLGKRVRALARSDLSSHGVTLGDEQMVRPDMPTHHWTLAESPPKKD